MSQIQKLQHEHGWSDKTLLDLLLRWVGQKTKRNKKVLGFLTMIAEGEELASGERAPLSAGNGTEAAKTRFRCPNCELTLLLSAIELMEVGEPYCPDCDGKPFSPHAMQVVE